MKPVLDISEFQTGIDYAKAAQDISGVIIRCGGTGYGSSHSVYNDSRFEEHYKGFHDQGVPIGAYFYAGAVTDIQIEAELTMTRAMLSGKELALPVYYDVEVPQGDYLNLSVSERTRLALSYIRGVKEMGFTAGLYTYVSYVRYLDMDSFLLYPVWMAQYYSYLEYGGHCELWQYTSDGSIDGYSGRVDLSKVMSDGWWEMQNISVPVQDPTESVKETIEMTVPALSNGDKGNAVKSLQGILQANGFDLEYCGGADGVFGAGTEYAVKAYQTQHGLDVDGVVGSQTWGEMFKA